jgi:hypothetical protein
MFLLKYFENVLLGEKNEISTVKLGLTKSPFLALGAGHFVKKAGEQMQKSLMYESSGITVPTEYYGTLLGHRLS